MVCGPRDGRGWRRCAAAISGDIRVAAGWSVTFAAAGLVLTGIGAFLATYGPGWSPALMAVGALVLVVSQWGPLSQWGSDLLTVASGGRVTYVWNGVTYAPDFWSVLFGSVSVLGFAGAALFVIVGAALTYTGGPRTADRGARARRTAAA